MSANPFNNVTQLYNQKMQQTVQQMGEYMRHAQSCFESLVNTYINLEISFVNEIPWPDTWDGHPVRIAHESFQRHKLHLQELGTELRRHINTHIKEVDTAVLVMNQIQAYLAARHEDEIKNYLQTTKQDWFFEKAENEQVGDAMKIDAEAVTQERNRLSDLLKFIEEFKRNKDEQVVKMEQAKMQREEVKQKNLEIEAKKQFEQISKVPTFQQWKIEFQKNHPPASSPDAEVNLVQRYCVQAAPFILPAIEYKQPKNKEEATKTAYQLVAYLSNQQQQENPHRALVVVEKNPNSAKTEVDKKIIELYKDVMGELKVAIINQQKSKKVRV